MSVDQCLSTSGLHKALEDKVEDADGRSWRNKVSNVGIVEGAEGSNPSKFVSDWLRSWVPADSLSNCFIVKRAYRYLAQKSSPGALPPHSAPLNYADRNVVLRAAKTKALSTLNHLQLSSFRIIP